jgi:hypothetical protein
MIDLTPTLTQAQIATALVLIAGALVYYVLNKYPPKARKYGKKKNR